MIRQISLHDFIIIKSFMREPPHMELHNVKKIEYDDVKHEISVHFKAEVRQCSIVVKAVRTEEDAPFGH